MSNSDGFGPPDKSEHDEPGELPPQPTVPEEAKINQVLGGAKNIASRAQNYYDNTINPAFGRSSAKENYDKTVGTTTKNVTNSVKQTVTEQHNKFSSTQI